MSQHGDLEIAGDVATELASAALALARRFSAGATLWCWAPRSPHHAQHVAVEFVHPVIVGSRALPAVAVTADDAADALRPLARAGDVLLVVAADSTPVTSMIRRAEAWGLDTTWVGAGCRPSGATADHLLWVSDDLDALRDGRVVLGYHVLWELTQVCLEHPGLLIDEIDGASEVDQIDDPVVCITCADEGRLGEVVDGDDHGATVRTPTGLEVVSTRVVGPVHPGDLVLVHAGTAITIVDP